MGGRRFSDEDLERNEDPRAVAGAVTGATGAGLGAGTGMIAAGPVGAVLGALIGAAGGWWVGKGFQQTIEEADEHDENFRRAHEHAGATHSYEEVRHAYQVGYVAGRNPRNEDASFDDIDEELRAAWVEAHKHEDDPVRWDDVRHAARRGFELARNPA